MWEATRSEAMFLNPVWSKLNYGREYHHYDYNYDYNRNIFTAIFTFQPFILTLILRHWDGPPPVFGVRGAVPIWKRAAAVVGVTPKPFSTLTSHTKPFRSQHVARKNTGLGAEELTSLHHFQTNSLKTDLIFGCEEQVSKWTYWMCLVGLQCPH